MLALGSGWTLVLGSALCVGWGFALALGWSGDIFVRVRVRDAVCDRVHIRTRIRCAVQARAPFQVWLGLPFAFGFRIGVGFGCGFAFGLPFPLRMAFKLPGKKRCENRELNSNRHLQGISQASTSGTHREQPGEQAPQARSSCMHPKSTVPTNTSARHHSQTTRTSILNNPHLHGFMTASLHSTKHARGGNPQTTIKGLHASVQNAIAPTYIGARPEVYTTSTLWEKVSSGVRLGMCCC